MLSSSDAATAAKGTAVPARPDQPPENGRAGLRHWRHDLLAGFVVSLVSLPLSSGIAIASGAPPIYGLISSIIAGLVFPFVGGSYVTISGPAAGLAPALLAIMVSLGGAGSAESVGAGYEMLLVVIFITGVVQMIMARAGLARFAAIFPASVVEGMLGAIGVLILVKALPLFVGFTGEVHAHGFAEYLGALPGWIRAGDHAAAAVGIASLVVLLATGSKAARRFQIFQKAPPHVFGALIGTIGAIALGLASRDPKLMISVPANPLEGVTLPAFGELLGRPDLWTAAAVGVVTLTLIDGVESLATAQAVDRIDPFHRRSEPSRVLGAMGISNVVSSLVGGLTVIPGGVKSKTCIEAGGRTLWANFANAVFLLLFLFVAPGLMALLPKATLGAILVYTGWKMIHPSIARHLAHVGGEQLVLYGITVAGVLATDLLEGILIGTAAKLVLVAVHARRAGVPAGKLLRSLFANPVRETEQTPSAVVLHVDHPVVCFNAYKLIEALDALVDEPRHVTVRLEAGTAVLDHTALEALKASGANLRSAEGAVHVEGLDVFDARSPHPTALRVRRAG